MEGVDHFINWQAKSVSSVSRDRSLLSGSFALEEALVIGVVGVSNYTRLLERKPKGCVHELRRTVVPSGSLQATSLGVRQESTCPEGRFAAAEQGYWRTLAAPLIGPEGRLSQARPRSTGGGNRTERETA